MDWGAEKILASNKQKEAPWASRPNETDGWGRWSLGASAGGAEALAGRWATSAQGRENKGERAAGRWVLETIGEGAEICVHPWQKGYGSRKKKSEQRMKIRAGDEEWNTRILLDVRWDKNQGSMEISERNIS
jgi:hypothetical protein